MTPLRERFIEDMKRVWDEDCLPDLSLVEKGKPNSAGSVGRFKDRSVHKMWQGYQLAHGVTHQEIAMDKKHAYMGHYIVGRVEGKKVIFSRAPYRHAHRKLADAEAERLVAEHGGQFSIWRCVDVVPKTSGASE